MDDNAHFNSPIPQVQKEYARPFLVEPTKLTRMVDKIHDRPAEQAEGPARDRFEVFMSGDRHEELTSLDQVLALDNSERQREIRDMFPLWAFPPQLPFNETA